MKERDKYVTHDAEGHMKIQLTPFIAELHEHFGDDMHDFTLKLAGLVDKAPPRFKGIPYVFKQCAALSFVAQRLLYASIGAGSAHMDDNDYKDDEKRKTDKLHVIQLMTEIFARYLTDQMNSDKSLDHTIKVRFEVKEK